MEIQQIEIPNLSSEMIGNSTVDQGSTHQLAGSTLKIVKERNRYVIKMTLCDLEWP